MTAVINQPVETPGPPGHSRDFWRKHWDKIAVLRVDTDRSRALRREELAASVAVLLTSGRSNRGTQDRIVADFCRNWHTDKAWVTLTFALRNEFAQPPSKLHILQYLDFPPSASYPALKDTRKPKEHRG